MNSRERPLALLILVLTCTVLLWSRGAPWRDALQEHVQKPVSAAPSSAATRWTLGDKLAWQEASEKDFIAVPGLGPKQRSQILTWQREQGLAKSWEDVLAIPGIGPKAIQQLQKYFYFSEAERSVSEPRF